MQDTLPEYDSITRWCQRSGMSRSVTYEALSRGDLIAVKLGAKTLIAVRPGLAWLASLPAPKVAVGKRAPGSGQAR